MTHEMTDRAPLITKGFLALNGVVFLSFCNIAIFFQFHQYLGTLPIDPRWFGMLIGIFSLAVLVVRPIVSPFLHPANAKRWMAYSCCFVVVSLVLYNWATAVWSLALVRVLHGAAYVVMAAAVVAKLVAYIPAERSGQAFGLISVITLLPYAVIPPLMEPVTRWTGGFNLALDVSAAIMLLTFPLLAMVGDQSPEMAAQDANGLAFKDVLHNLRDWKILILLLLSLLVWTAFLPVFFFLQGQGEKIGATNPGWFFTLSTFTEIGVRLIGGRWFDRPWKARLLLGSLIWLGVGYAVMAHLSDPTVFYAMGLFMGLGWGVAMPVLSGLVFDLSEVRFRALNTNLSMQMFQAGFLVGPLVGAPILAHFGYVGLYYACCGVSLAGVVAALPLRGQDMRTSSPA